MISHKVNINIFVSDSGGEERLFLKKNHVMSGKGIRFHYRITAFFLNIMCKIFGLPEKIIEIQDKSNKIYYVNRGSLERFLKNENQTIDSYDTEFSQKSKDIAKAIKDKYNKLLLDKTLENGEWENWDILDNLLAKCDASLFKEIDDKGKTTLHKFISGFIKAPISLKREAQENIKGLLDYFPIECHGIKNKKGETPIHFLLRRAQITTENLYLLELLISTCHPRLLVEENAAKDNLLHLLLERLMLSEILPFLRFFPDEAFQTLNREKKIALQLALEKCKTGDSLEIFVLCQLLERTDPKTLHVKNGELVPLAIKNLLCEGFFIFLKNYLAKDERLKENMPSSILHQLLNKQFSYQEFLELGTLFPKEYWAEKDASGLNVADKVLFKYGLKGYQEIVDLAGTEVLFNKDHQGQNILHRALKSSLPEVALLELITMLSPQQFKETSSDGKLPLAFAKGNQPAVIKAIAKEYPEGMHNADASGKSYLTQLIALNDIQRIKVLASVEGFKLADQQQGKALLQLAIDKVDIPFFNRIIDAFKALGLPDYDASQPDPHYPKLKIENMKSFMPVIMAQWETAFRNDNQEEMRIIARSLAYLHNFTYLNLSNSILHHLCSASYGVFAFNQSMIGLIKLMLENGADPYVFNGKLDEQYLPEKELLYKWYKREQYIKDTPIDQLFEKIETDGESKDKILSDSSSEESIRVWRKIWSPFEWVMGNEKLREQLLPAVLAVSQDIETLETLQEKD